MKNVSFLKQTQKTAVVIVLFSGFFALTVAVINPYPDIFVGWLSTFLLSSCTLALLYMTWLLISPCKTSGYAVSAALAARLIFAVFLFAALPVWGHDKAPANNGYLFLDAFRRDSDAWTLAQSGETLNTAFQNTFSTDQYGGLLALSAAVYRFSSPQAHRPLLIVLIGASVCTLGIPFLWDATRKRWGENTACWSVWLYALYPESLVLGASQMREPFLIGLSAIAFWSVMTWRENRTARTISAVVSLMLCGAISLSAGTLMAAAFAVLFFFENFYLQFNSLQKRISLLILACVLIGGAFLGWGLLTDYASYDMYLMEAASGRVAYELENIGGFFKAPFIIAYGIAQPVLPASIAYPGIPLARGIAIFRSAGWYFLIPFLLFSLFMISRAEPRKDRILAIVLASASFSWILLSSARAGGDQWDNPRYRAIFLIWQVVLAAWSIMQYQKTKSPWLSRIIFIETVFVVFFLQWYLSRYFDLFDRLFFWQMVLVIITIAAFVLIGGWIADTLKQRRHKA